MPKIPIYERSVGLTPQGPNVEVDTRRFASGKLAEARFLQESARDMAQVSSTGFNIRDKMLRAQMVDDFSQMDISAKSELFKLRESVKDNPDPNSWVPSIEEKGQDILDRHLSMTQFPGVQAQFKRHWATIFPTLVHGAMVDARNEKINIFKGNADQYLEKSVDLFGQAKTPLEQQQVVDGVGRLLEEGVAAHFIKPQDREKIYGAFEKKIKYNMLNAEVVRNPWQAKADLETSGAYGLDDTQRAHALPSVEAAIHRKQNEFYTGYAKKVIDGENNPGAMPTEQELQEALKNNFLNPHAYHQLDTMVKSAGRKSDKGNETNSYYQIVSRFNDDTNPLTVAELFRNVGTGFDKGGWDLPPKEIEHWADKIRNKDTKVQKLEDHTIDTRKKMWLKKFKEVGFMGPPDENTFQPQALGTLQNAIDEGEFKGLSADEITRKIDSVFQPAYRDLQEYNNIGKGGGKKQKPAGFFSKEFWTGGEKTKPAANMLPETMESPMGTAKRTNRYDPQGHRLYEFPDGSVRPWIPE